MTRSSRFVERHEAIIGWLKPEAPAELAEIIREAAYALAYEPQASPVPFRAHEFSPTSGLCIFCGIPQGVRHSVPCDNGRGWPVQHAEPDAHGHFWRDDETPSRIAL